MHEIIPHVYLGNATDARSFITFIPITRQWHNRHGITGVVNCSGVKPGTCEPEVGNHFDAASCKERGIPFNVEYLFLGLTETTHVSESIASDVVSFISRHVTGGGNVLVHCVAGLQRSPSIVLVYLLSTGVGFMDGLRLIEERKGGYIYPTPPMLRSIARLENDGKRVDGREITRFTRDYRGW